MEGRYSTCEFLGKESARALIDHSMSKQVATVGAQANVSESQDGSELFGKATGWGVTIQPGENQPFDFVLTRISSNSSSDRVSRMAVSPGPPEYVWTPTLRPPFPCPQIALTTYSSQPLP